ncbi:Cytochrome c-550 PedF [Halomonas sp. 59]|nr:Cytochrome c-550 PedF [Halomonas sp. 59]CAD5260752.1 Cytochrome c-550 PedF [Halomonas sp. 113]CAD5274710.1 Cytochrome c550, associated with quino(hemo)protein alcohol dehydrogenase [Halomonas sp. I3]CAD5287916.1 Cytochrome c-550 PedF [Halomonas sp. 156]VXB40738.1 Cytochrome c-550 PedF [Halomonas titanicae]
MTTLTKTISNTISKTHSKTVTTAISKTASTKTPIGQAGAIALMALLAAPLAWSHGSVTPQAVDIKDLERLGDEWREENPYRDHPQHDLAVDIGARAYNSNCAACHGLEAKSGGIAPDLRELENGPWGDEWFKELVTNGSERNGRVLMPRMSDYVSQEGLWAIRTWLETVSIETTRQ